ncbi:MAG: hypothetical protein HY286_07265 [Planctomycetes bacterium]|nr:hypothetical protein [Planctomycetota bacterium]
MLTNRYNLTISKVAAYLVLLALAEAPLSAQGAPLRIKGATVTIYAGGAGLGVPAQTSVVSKSFLMSAEFDVQNSKLKFNVGGGTGNIKIQNQANQDVAAQITSISVVYGQSPQDPPTQLPSPPFDSACGLFVIADGTLGPINGSSGSITLDNSFAGKTYYAQALLNYNYNYVDNGVQKNFKSSSESTTLKIEFK